ncbi:hypothetical protein [Allochromatium vinosum]|uniref:Uncharacterized protein n=1 Tax=Allochromatium vinosum (strain ATCC 17899 / DSM 180 / NBRC 103801 / NCIMB 10441 / D) TaxID=572477 RepID=D3RNV9_ALLVD|nr:hypothetical protein [Allochromatium vinosum]ADC61469.1 conserved hypothetical protein [Allochromatium vinosum DSM 180]MBK1654301.1 hypothetical protein [Allochromatium vinosum]
MNDENSRRRVWLWLGLGSILGLGAILVIVQAVWPVLYPSASHVAPLDLRCDLRAGPCESRFGGGRVRFGIEPRTLPVAAPLRLEVELSGLTAEAVEVDFVGVEMYMGFNRVALESLGEGRYAGHGMIPVCTSERMTWEARVLIHTPDGLLAAPFRFESAP